MKINHSQNNCYVYRFYCTSDLNFSFYCMSDVNIENTDEYVFVMVTRVTFCGDLVTALYTKYWHYTKCSQILFL